MYYIGCSSNLSTRIEWHLSMLKSLKHTNKGLQQAFIDYGEPIVEILEYCTLEVLKDREIYWIKEFNSFISGFNNTNGGDGGGFGEGMHNSLYSKEVYINILKILVNTSLSLRDVAKHLDVNLGTVKHISSLASHGWLEEEYPEEYRMLREKYNNKLRNNSAASKGINYPKLLSPEGIEYTVNNIHAFCREHNLQAQNLHKVLTQQRRIHKGWVLIPNIL